MRAVWSTSITAATMKRCIDLMKTALRVLAYLLFGPKYTGNHDYRSMRLRYSHHVWAYGWTRSWRFGPWVVDLFRDDLRNANALSPRIRIKRVATMKSPYWRDLNCLSAFRPFKWSVSFFCWQETTDRSLTGKGQELIGNRMVREGWLVRMHRSGDASTLDVPTS